MRHVVELGLLAVFLGLVVGCTDPERPDRSKDPVPPGRDWLQPNHIAAREICALPPLDPVESANTQIHILERDNIDCNRILLEQMHAVPIEPGFDVLDDSSFMELLTPLYAALLIDLGDVDELSEIHDADQTGLIDRALVEELEYVGRSLGYVSTNDLVYDMITSMPLETQIYIPEWDEVFGGLASNDDFIAYAYVDHETRVLVVNGRDYGSGMLVRDVALFFHEAAHLYLQRHHMGCLFDPDIGEVCDADWSGALAYEYGIHGIAAATVEDDRWFSWLERGGTETDPSLFINSEYLRLPRSD